MTSYNGHRATASNAFLSDAPHNLTIKTGLVVDRVILEGREAKSIETQGRQSKHPVVLLVFGRKLAR